MRPQECAKQMKRKPDLQAAYDEKEKKKKVEGETWWERWLGFKNNISELMDPSFLQNLPTSGLLAHISEKIVQRVVSPPVPGDITTF